MSTQVRKLAAGAETRAAIRDAVDCLTGGGLVAFPTETVYGIGASAVRPEAVARLREVKERSVDKPFTVHVGSKSDVERFVPELRGVGQRLINKAWPGPLTLVFQLDDVSAAPVVRETSSEHAAAMYHEGTIGIRCPDDPHAAQLLVEAGVPVVAASANPSGRPAPVDAEEVMASLDGRIDLLLDAGRTRYAGASTIVRVNGNGYELLREGVLDRRTIERLCELHLLVVCTGNTCRSPMAEGLLRRLLARKIQCDESQLEKMGIRIQSAGTLARDGAGPSSQAVHTLEARGIDISAHRTRPLTVDLINRADHILAMTDDHFQTIRAMVPGAEQRARRIADDDIGDPIGRDDETYKRCADTIEQALQQRLEEIPI